MKLIIGKPDETELMLAEQVGGAWRPNPNLAAEMAAFLQGADPEQFEMWVEEPEWAAARTGIHAGEVRAVARNALR